MSIKLEQAFANKQVLVKKVISGEVTVHFNDKNVKDITISHNGTIDLLSKRGVTVDHLRNSNLLTLVQERFIVVV